MATRDENKSYDVRILERNLRRGQLSRKDYEKYLKSLPDAADRATASKPDESPPEPRDPEPPAGTDPSA